MKPKLLAFPLTIILASSAIAGTYTWTGSSSTNWTDPANWDITTAPPSSPDTFPNYGSIYTADFLTIRNNGDLTNAPPGTTPGSGAIFNPGSTATTHFNLTTGRGFAVGIGNGPASTPPDTKGRADLTISSGTLKFTRSSNTGSEPFMANRADVNLLINGGHLDFSAHSNNFRLIQEGLTGITSTITIDNGSFSCRSLDLIFDSEIDPATVFGNGIINLNGGTFSPLRIIRSAASDPGQTSFTLNLNGGNLRAINSQTDFLNALTDLQTVVKSGGAKIDTNTFSITIAEILEHDSALGLTADGGLTKNGAGSLTLSGVNTFTGPVTVNAGTALATPSRILIPNDNAVGTGAITLADSFAEIQVNSTRVITNSISIANTGAEKTILLPSPGNGGFAAATFSGPIAINDTDIDHFRARADDNCFLTFSGVVSGSGGIFKYQPGRLDLTNASNSFTGGVKITHGAVSFTSGALGSTGQIRMEGTTGVTGVSLRWDPTNDQDISSRLVMFDAKAATLLLADGGSPFDTSNVTFASAIGSNSTGSLVKSGNGTLTLTQPSTYSGGTTLSQGTLEFANNGLATTGSVTMDGGILRWSTGNTQDLSSRIVMVNAKTASFSTNGNGVTFASAIGGSTTAGLTKTNTTGTLTLNGANTYSGTTTVGGGTLKTGNPNALGFGGPQRTTTPGTTVASGATLDLNGTTGINEPISINSTGVGALVNNSGVPAGISNGIAGLAVAATGSGSGYSTAPTVVISGTGTGAIAIASLGVTTASFAVTVAGNRTYTVAPTVTIAGGGTGATATAVLSGGSTGTVTGITVTSAGSGFTTAPTATISGGTSTGTTTTTFTGNATSFTVGGLALTNAGSGYTGTPTFTFNGSPATVTPTLSSVILASDSSVGGSGNATINAVVAESGGSRALTKAGVGTVTLNGANTYTGETKVDAGTLAINTDDTLANAAAVRIDSSAVLNLGFVGTDTVDRIFIGGVEQVAGTWGSLASSATNKTARIVGTGILDVTNGSVVASGYAAWKTANSTAGTLDLDHDNDGVSNGVEYFMFGNASSTGFTALPSVINNSVTWVKATTGYAGVYNTDFFVETSDTLATGSWAIAPLGVGAGNVEITGNNVKYTFPAGTKKFARLKVTGP